jgi:hypothetical protein
MGTMDVRGVTFAAKYGRECMLSEGRVSPAIRRSGGSQRLDGHLALRAARALLRDDHFGAGARAAHPDEYCGNAGESRARCHARERRERDAEVGRADEGLVVTYVMLRLRLTRSLGSLLKPRLIVGTA